MCCIRDRERRGWRHVCLARTSEWRKGIAILIYSAEDAHVGFNSPPDALGTKAFERAVEMINALPRRPDLVLFPGNLTQDQAEAQAETQATGSSF